MGRTLTAPTLAEANPAAPRRFATMGHRVIRFIESECVFTTAKWAGRPFRLLPWQRDLLLDLFEMVWDAEHTLEDGTQVGRWRRRYTEALIGVPKKNGKTELLSALAHYFLHADGELNPFIPVAAASERQADMIFGAAKRMAKLSPRLGARCYVFDREIQRRDNPDGAKIARLASNAGKNDGPNVFVALMDELHEWSQGNPEQNYNVLTNGTGARDQPMALSITTAGFDLDTLCGRLYEYGVKVAAGEVDDPAFFFRWYTAPDDLDWRSIEAVRVANPSYGAIQQQSFYDQQLKRKPEAVYRRYYLNQWTEGESAWLPFGTWARLERRGIALVPGAPTWVGWDSSTKVDSTAIVALQWITLGDMATKTDRAFLIAQAWIWERPIDRNTGEPDPDWLIPLTDEVVPLIHSLAEDFDLQAIAYDPAFVTWEAAKLQAGGYPMREFPQHTTRLTAASQGLYEAAVRGDLIHDGDARLARHVRAAAAKQTGGNTAWRLVKGAAKRRMDAVIGLAMALYYATRLDQEDEKKPKEPNLWGADDDDDDEATDTADE